MHILLDGTGRIQAVSPDCALAPGEGETVCDMELPDGALAGLLSDWRIVDGAPIYDPLPEPEPEPDPLADLAELVIDNTLEIELLKLQAEGGMTDAV